MLSESQSQRASAAPVCSYEVPRRENQIQTADGVCQGRGGRDPCSEGEVQSGKVSV